MIIEINIVHLIMRVVAQITYLIKAFEDSAHYLMIQGFFIMKKCKKCNCEKTGNEFYCLECEKKRHSEYRKTKDGLIKNIFLRQKNRCENNNSIDLLYSKIEFLHWFNTIGSEKFNTLFDKWVLSNYDKKLTPSIDRINEHGNYSLDNIQLLTWSENEAKGNECRKNGLNNKKSKRTFQYDLNGNFIAEYYSGTNASIETGIGRKAINNCCNGVTKTSGNFKWKNEQINIEL